MITCPNLYKKSITAFLSVLLMVLTKTATAMGLPPISLPDLSVLNLPKVAPTKILFTPAYLPRVGTDLGLSNGLFTLSSSGRPLCYTRTRTSCEAASYDKSSRLPILSNYFLIDVCDKPSSQNGILPSTTSSGSTFNLCNHLKATMQLIAARPDKSFAFVGDTQYPWYSIEKSTGSEKTDSQRDIPLLFNHINRLTPLPDSVVVIGDLTAFGHDWQVNTMKDYFKTLTPTVLLGLGNHDYFNNLNDNQENRNALRSIGWLEEGRANYDSFDSSGKKFYYDDGQNIDEYYGSFAWSKNYGNLHLVMLNLSPILQYNISNFNSYDATRKRIWIRSSMEWLDKDLHQARKEGKQILVFNHTPNFMDDSSIYDAKMPDDYKPFKGYTDETKKGEVESLLAKYNVSAVLSGHGHTINYDFVNGGVSRIMVGSPMDHSYIIGHYYAAESSLQLFEVDLDKTDETKKIKFVATLSLYGKAETLAAPTTKRSYHLRFINGGSFVAKFYLSYKDASGKLVNENSGDTNYGQGWLYEIPKGATEVVASGNIKTGLAWNEFPEVFRENVDKYQCFKIRGVTISYSAHHCDQ